MKPFDKLTEAEQEMIESYISDYGDSELDLECNHQSLDHILRFWNTNKEYLFHKFGDNLIIEKDFVYSKSYQEIMEEVSSSQYCKLEEFLQECSKTVIPNFFDDTTYRCCAIHKETSEEGDSKLIHLTSMISEVFSIKNSISNTVSIKNHYYYDSNYRYYIKLADNELVELIDGMKLNKILKKLASSYNLSGYEDYRILQSLLTNQKKIKGTLCLSIHPFDYMTMSDNDSGWSSCMSWRNYGEFRQGTVEMMNSPYVIVAYLKSDNTVLQQYGYSWNSKKWRLLIIASDDRICSIKSYPFFNEELTIEALNFTKEIFTGTEEWDDTLYVLSSSETDPSFINLTSKEYPILHNVHFHTNVMYNDFNTTLHFCYKRDLNSNSLSELNYSGEAECMYCGELLLNSDNSETATCLRCHMDNATFCENCGCSLAEDEACWGDDGYPYCQECFDEYFTQTIFSEDFIDKERAKEIKIIDENGDKLAIGYEYSLKNTYNKCYGKGVIYYDDEEDEWYIPITDFNSSGLELIRYAWLDDIDDSKFWNTLDRRLLIMK